MSARRLRRSSRPRRRFRWGPSTVGSACQNNDNGPAGCEISQQASVPASPLTLLADAHLERLGATFALTAVDDDGATVRLGNLRRDRGRARPRADARAAGRRGRPVGDAREPDRSGRHAARRRGDRRTERRRRRAARGGRPDVRRRPRPRLISAPRWRSSRGALAGGAGPTVALGASRAGPHAVLAWIDPKTGAVTELVMSAAGEPIGQPRVLETGARLRVPRVHARQGRAHARLSQVPGHHDARPDLRDRGARRRGRRRHDARAVPRFARRRLPAGHAHERRLRHCVPGRRGVLARRLRRRDEPAHHQRRSRTRRPSAAPTCSRPWPGSRPWARTSAPCSISSHRRRSSGVFRAAPDAPAASGCRPRRARRDSISTQPDSGIITVTYADYTSVDGATGTAGQRYFLRLTCH